MTPAVHKVQQKGISRKSKQKHSPWEPRLHASYRGSLGTRGLGRLQLPQANQFPAEGFRLAQSGLDSLLSPAAGGVYAGM